MRFLALSPQAALLLMAGVAVAILLAYLIRPRRRRIVVGSHLIWRRVGAGARAGREPLRWLLSLLLAMAIGLAIALALARPEVAAVAGDARRIVLVMDTAPTMAARTRDGASRWRHALQQAQRIIQGAGPASEFAVLDTMGQAPSTEFVDAAAALDRLTRLEPARAGSARMPWLPPEDPTAPWRREVVLVTDGVAPLEVTARAQVQSVFEAADNAAILSFEARPEPRDPTRYQALVQVLNASPADRRVLLELSGEDRFLASRELEIPAGQSVYPVFDVSAFAAGTLRARVRLAGDALSADDLAYTVIPPHAPRQVVLVSTGNRWLEQVLGLLPGILLTVVTPDDYAATTDQEQAAELFIFDGFAPSAPPRSSALLFGPGMPAWIEGTASEVGKVVVTRWDPSHPLSQDLPWRDLHVRRAGLQSAAVAAGGIPSAAAGGPPAETEGGVPVVQARGSAEGERAQALVGTLVGSGSTPRPWVRVGFALSDSNLAQQAGFPVFMSRAIEWLSPRPVPLVRDLGVIELPWGRVTVTDGGGHTVAVAGGADATRFEAQRPGIYRARQGDIEHTVVVNALDPRHAGINRSRFAGTPRNAPMTAEPPPSPVEPWWLLAAVALVLLVIEWMTYSRRLTV